METIENFIRKDLREKFNSQSLYTTNLARDRKICLDSNEWWEGYSNRYPNPLQTELRRVLANIFSVEPEQVMATNGSDEAIDLLFRLFCIPGVDNILIPQPSYSMYKSIADFNGIETIPYPIDLEIGYGVEKIISRVNSQSKILVVCTPNNPTSHCLSFDQLEKILLNFQGIVLLDEAYSEFSTCGGLLSRIGIRERVVVLKTLSKAYGLAGLRIGAIIACETLIRWLLKVKMPYNVNAIASNGISEIEINHKKLRERVQYVKQWVSRLSDVLSSFSFVEKIFPSETNFLLIQVNDALSLKKFLEERNILIRSRDDIPNGLRITIGSPEENQKIIESLQLYEELIVKSKKLWNA